MPARPQTAASVKRPTLPPAQGQRRAEQIRTFPSPPSATASTGPGRTRSWRPARRGAPTAKPGARPERVAGEDDDVGGRLDVGERGEGDPAGDRQRRQRRDQRHDLRRRPRALVPGEAGEQHGAEDQEAGQLPAHQPHASPGPEHRGALLGGDRRPGRSRTRATSVAKYQPPERTSAAGAVGDRRRRRRAGPPARRKRRRTRRRGWRRRRAAPRRSESVDQLDQVVLAGPVHPAGRLVEGDQARQLARPPSARPARSPAPAAAARRRRGRAGRRRPRARARPPAAPPSLRPRAARRRPARGPGSRRGSG